MSYTDRQDYAGVATGILRSPERPGPHHHHHHLQNPLKNLGTTMPAASGDSNALGTRNLSPSSVGARYAARLAHQDSAPTQHSTQQQQRLQNHRSSLRRPSLDLTTECCCPLGPIARGRFQLLPLTARLPLSWTAQHHHPAIQNQNHQSQNQCPPQRPEVPTTETGANNSSAGDSALHLHHQQFPGASSRVQHRQPKSGAGSAAGSVPLATSTSPRNTSSNPSGSCSFGGASDSKPYCASGASSVGCASAGVVVVPGFGVGSGSGCGSGVAVEPAASAVTGSSSSSSSTAGSSAGSELSDSRASSCANLAATTAATTGSSRQQQDKAGQQNSTGQSQQSSGGHSVPQKLAQWTKLQGLRLQEPAVTAVDRLQRFRWSGGGGGHGKKSSAGPRTDKTEKLRELTEKLKGPCSSPSKKSSISPTRIKSPSPVRNHLSTTQSPPGTYSRLPSEDHPPQQPQQFSCRSNTFSEGTRASQSSSPSRRTSRTGGCLAFGRSESADSYEPASSSPKSPSKSPEPQQTRASGLPTSPRSRSPCCEFSEANHHSPAPAAAATAAQGPGESGGDNHDAEELENRASDELAASVGEDAARAAAPMSEEEDDSLPDRHQPHHQKQYSQHGRSASCSRVELEIDDVPGSSADGPSPSLLHPGASTNPSAAHQVRASTLPRCRTASSNCGPRPKCTVALELPGAQPMTRQQSLGPEAARPAGREQLGARSHSMDLGGLAAQSVARNEEARPGDDGAQKAEETRSRKTSVIEPHEVIITPPPIDDDDPETQLHPEIPEFTLDHQPNQTQKQLSSETETGPTNDTETEIDPESEIGPAQSASSTATSGAPIGSTGGKLRRYRGDTSKRRKGIYITQWPEPATTTTTTTTTATATSGQNNNNNSHSNLAEGGISLGAIGGEDQEQRGKLSGQSSEEREETSATTPNSDLSDGEGQVPRRYNKRPLRGPYGQMLEAEMAKQRSTDIILEDTLKPRRKTSASNLSYTGSHQNTNHHQNNNLNNNHNNRQHHQQQHRHHQHQNNSSSNNNHNNNSQSLGVDKPNSGPPAPCHQRTTSSPSKLEGLPASPELLAELLRGSSERVARTATNHLNDTRTHVVVELYDTERSYVEALQILVNKYLQPLKSPESAAIVDSATVDEIFYQIPEILRHHEVFLEELHKRLETWEIRQTIGDVFLEVFTKPVVLETYTMFLDNWKSARNAIKTTCQAKPAFARFIETMEREHKGKLGLDQLLIKPVQKIPRYELLIQRLLKHTDPTHPDHELLRAAQKEIHELVVKINCTERESLEWEQQQSTLKEVQSIVEGLAGIVANDRTFIRHDLVSIASNQGTRKERALFLFSDLLVITSIKRRSGTIRKPSSNPSPNSLVGLIEANKYKLLMRIPLEDLEIVKAKDENLRKMAKEVDFLREDCATLTQIQELASTLHGVKQQLEDLIKEMLVQTQKQLTERNAAHSQLACLELTLNTQTGVENISVMFTKPDKRASWEESFNEAKQKLTSSTDRRPCPEFVGSLPIRKTRAGLQFTCAAATFINGQGSRDVWVCNSDGYVGQICVLSLSAEPPQVVSCNGVCSTRILCITGIPSCDALSRYSSPLNNSYTSTKNGGEDDPQHTDASSGNIQLDSSSSSDDSDSDDVTFADNTSVSIGGDVSSLEGGTIDEDLNQPTMWLGTEDGCIHIYNCTDNIRIKKNKVKIFHGSSIHAITYLDNKVFVSLANGDIIVYSRDHVGGWNTLEPTTLTVGTAASPIIKMLPVSGRLWCATHNTIKVINPQSLDLEHSFVVHTDNTHPISCIAGSGGLGVWISLHNSAALKLYHAGNFECLADINVAPAVTNMLSNCDDIIRQHKAACLRVTALLACNELLWIGTSAGVILTVPIPHIKPSTQRMSQVPTVTGVPHGHTGQVRFITTIEIPSTPKPQSKFHRFSWKSGKTQQQNNVERGKILIISGGDGYEDFRGPQASAELQAGREDSTNHLLLWKV